MFSQELIEWCGDEHVRIDWMLPLPLAINHESMSDLLDGQVIDDLENWPAVEAMLGLSQGDLDGIDELGHMDRNEEITQALYDRQAKPALIVRIATPIRRRKGQVSGGFMFSWGYYTTHTFRIESLDELLPKMQAWLEARDIEWTKEPVA